MDNTCLNDEILMPPADQIQDQEQRDPGEIANIDQIAWTDNQPAILF